MLFGKEIISSRKISDGNNKAEAIKKIDKMKHLFVVFISLFILGMSSCLHTKVPRSKAAGNNTGFEVSERGLPANWIIYDPPHVKYYVSFDTVEYREGRQSLRFDVLKAANKGRVNYTGLTNEFMSLTKGGGKFRLSYWVMNRGTSFRIYINGVGAKSSGTYPVIIEEANSIPDWKLYESEIDISPEMWLRFDVKIFKEGSFWIDGLAIERL